MTTVFSDIREQLCRLGYRDTEGRRLAINVVAAQSRPFTAAEPCASLPCVRQATALRGLGPLMETDQVCRVLPEDHELRHRLSRPGRRHHPLCAVCGVRADLERSDAEGMRREAVAAAGFRMGRHRPEVHGQCVDE